MAEAQQNWVTNTSEETEEETELKIYALTFLEKTVVAEALQRGKFLLFLLALQSSSSFVLSTNEKLD